MPGEGGIPEKPPILYMEELFKDKQFHTYQTRVMIMMNNFINSLMSQGKMEQAFGAMQMARMVIEHPAVVRSDDPIIRQKVDASKKRFQSNFIMSNGLMPEVEE